jgi:hypothetical protein
MITAHKHAPRLSWFSGVPSSDPLAFSRAIAPTNGR